MHACGHDGHIAIGLGVAEGIIRFKEYLSGTIKLIFQPEKKVYVVEIQWLNQES